MHSRTALRIVAVWGEEGLYSFLVSTKTEVLCMQTPPADPDHQWRGQSLQWWYTPYDIELKNQNKHYRTGN